MFAVRVWMDPTARTVFVNVSWAPRGADPVSLDVNVSVWVEGANTGGGSPAPASVGCVDAATGGAAACTATAPSLLSQRIYASRKAATRAESPHPVWAGLAAGVVGLPAATTPASYSVTSRAAGKPFEVEVRFTMRGGDSPLTIVLAEAELHGTPPPSNDPGISAAAVVGAASPLGSLRAAATWWAAYWGKSSISFPDAPALEQLWYGAQYIFACTSSSSAGVPAPGLYGVWATSDGAAWNGDYTLDYNYQSPYYGAFSSNHGEQVGGSYVCGCFAPGNYTVA